MGGKIKSGEGVAKYSFHGNLFHIIFIVFSPTDLELKPILSKHMADDLPPTIYEEEKDYSMENGLDTFGQPNVERNGTIPRSYSSLPRKKPMTRDFDEVSNDGSFRPTKRPGKSSSIVSIETVSINNYKWTTFY